ncbi:MAG: flagellar hook-associated protein FlgL [Pseudonocardia sp.]|nr:flagellar hook-associated protein FlgL [Pseudonocardia sp.]
MSQTVATGLQGALGRLQDVQGELASGKRINRYSDAPPDAAAAMRLRAEESDWSSYAKAADDGTAWLNTQDQALQTASTLLQRVRELTVAAGNSTTSASEREAMATEVDNIRDQLAGIANTTYLGQSVFGGFSVTAVTKSGSSWAWSGDAGAVQRRVTPDVTVQVNSDGATVFGFAAGQTNVFATLDQVSSDMRAGNVGSLTTDLNAIDTRAQAITTGLSVVGARTSLIDASKTAGSAQLSTIKDTRSSLEDVDVAQSALELQLAQTGYQAALAAAGRIALPTLADFLK